MTDFVPRRSLAMAVLEQAREDGRVPRSELARYSQIDYDREMTFIALTPADGHGAQAMVGDVRAVCDPDNERAEFAIQAASGWQGKGLGHVLMEN